ncbi:MAG: hypothetical protein V7K67_31305 [Nostoc sp.]|uniref:hypothetical protein n=1 Tax=Nostoc sp. TaxID=1180 RepID=UPI002FF51060
MTFTAFDAQAETSSPSASCPLPSAFDSLLPSALCPLPSSDAQAIAQLEFAIHLTQQSENTAYYEIDSTDDIFGKLYRVWGGEKGINLLGTFYQNLDGFWVSQPCNTSARGSWATDTQAVNAILAT